MRKLMLAVIVGAAFMTSGCGSKLQIATSIASAAQSASTAIPNQVSTLYDAEQTVTLVANAANVIAQNVTLPKATLQQGLALSDALGVALTNLENAQAKGQSLDFAAFNSALQAFQTYKQSLPATPAAT